MTGAVVLAVLVVVSLLLLFLAGLARAAGREMPKPPPRSDRDRGA